LLAAQARSGLSLLAFAQSQDLCYASLRRWRSADAGAIKGAAARRPARRGSATPGFIPVQLESSAPAGELTLCWASGCSLRIPVGFDPDHLRRLLAVLEARS